MWLYDKIKKLFDPDTNDPDTNDSDAKNSDSDIPVRLQRRNNDYSFLFDSGIPFVADRNFITLFETVPEVAFPVLYISDRIAGGNYQLKRTKDDSVIWDNEQINKLLNNPNSISNFSEFIKTYYCYYYVTGNAYIEASISDTFSKKGEIWEWCDNYWVLPSNRITINTPLYVPLFSNAERDKIIKSYRLTVNGQMRDINPNAVLHKKEINLSITDNFLQGKSRLASRMMPVSNLISVYEARNVIYTKRGALGAIVNRQRDESGDVLLTPKEKDEIRKENLEIYGLRKDKSPVAIINHPVDFVRMNMSIRELMPFEETFEDAIQIAAAYGIPSILVTRKDQGTYSNQPTAERSVYSSIIIPEAKRFCNELSSFLGLEKSGMYLDVDFSHIAVMKEGFKEEQQTKALTSEKCGKEFLSGIITLNDWRAQIGESKVEDPIYSKLILQMDDKELDRIRTILTIQSNGRIENQNIQN
ncbi:MAG: phage portal protein [Candidatus Azobacteroides sp.]|nr:phage portal protein [Candidatus Azobacteroides sp.]